MTWLVAAVSAVLAAVAVAGVLRPFRRPESRALEATTDPLEDERSGLIRSLRELDDEHATGQLSEETYLALRHETEVRAVAVLRSLEARDGLGAMGTELRSLRSRHPAGAIGNGDGAAMAVTTPRGRRNTVALVIGVIVVGVVAAVLARSVQSRTSGEQITGTTQGGLGFFQQRVADHPNDVAARLDLAQRYLETGDPRSAIQQYVAVLELDPRNAEAHAQLGFLVYEAGRPADGLAAVQKALEVDPTYPEALYYEGVILLKGLNRPVEAATAFRAYLQAAPFGAHRDEVERLLTEAEGSG
jgi:tetratricopeptide (TPR) repeat protein